MLASIITNFTCFPWHQENDSDCGGASGLSASLWLTVTLQLVLLWILTDSRHHAIPSWPLNLLIAPSLSLSPSVISKMATSMQCCHRNDKRQWEALVTNKKPVSPTSCPFLHLLRSFSGAIFTRHNGICDEKNVCWEKSVWKMWTNLTYAYHSSCQWSPPAEIRGIQINYVWQLLNFFWLDVIDESDRTAL